ncbi:MAG: hypothetical protein J6S85_01070 [Methanobrevibacter sp.]|nr:hypothetical protein [Methanobrevibacter sp.]MBO7712123.1 hypothetical protein [Methanobrevibacter sp.]
MNKYLLNAYGYERNAVCVCEAENLNDAFVEFADYFGIAYPLTKEDVKNLFKDFTIEKFIQYFENEYTYKVYSIYEIKETIFETKLKEME